MIEVLNADELDHLFDDIASNTDPEYPTIVYVYAHDYQVGLGLGNNESFVHFELETGEPPYVISVGDSNAEGVLAFYLFNNHHTEIPRRNLIPTMKAREIVSQWITTALRPLNIKWEEV
jgi:hypothetical protein